MQGFFYNANKKSNLIFFFSYFFAKVGSNYKVGNNKQKKKYIYASGITVNKRARFNKRERMFYIFKQLNCV